MKNIFKSMDEETKLMGRLVFIIYGIPILFIGGLFLFIYLFY
jgi:hypothetical protein